MAVLLVEYPGYGRSEGKPSRGTIQQAFEAAYDWALSRPDVDPARVVFYGRSLGGAVVAALSATRPAAALILESSFTRTADFARGFAAPSFLVRDRFDNLAALRAFRGPRLVLHGDRDVIVPTEHGRRLADAAGVELYLMSGGHNDCARPWEVVRAFFVENGILR
jgi:pimeloyl-ACP methyl ester carboxylesterase